LVRGLIQGILPNEEVPSPTYTLVQSYVFELGLVDVLDDVVSLIEWPDKMGEHLPQNTLPVHIEFVKDGRDVIFGQAWSERGLESIEHEPNANPFKGMHRREVMSVWP